VAWRRGLVDGIIGIHARRIDAMAVVSLSSDTVASSTLPDTTFREHAEAHVSVSSVCRARV